MAPEVEGLAIHGAFVIRPPVYADGRGKFLESWRSDVYPVPGGEAFVQDNLSYSNNRVLRGLHYQVDDPQGQMVTLVSGEIQDVLVDLRPTSRTFLQHLSFDLSQECPMQIYMPPGIAHGFCVLSEVAILHYKCTRFYNPATERGVRWDDPRLAIKWKIENPIVSDRDEAFPLLENIEEFLSHLGELGIQ